MRARSWKSLRHDVTPPCLHYLLIHFDVPYVPSAAGWTLAIGGLVERPLQLTLDELRRCPERTLRVTLDAVFVSLAQQPLIVAADPRLLAIAIGSSLLQHAIPFRSSTFRANPLTKSAAQSGGRRTKTSKETARSVGAVVPRSRRPRVRRGRYGIWRRRLERAGGGSSQSRYPTMAANPAKADFPLVERRD